ncbi:hypothetical protein [Streptomyces sp. NPDC059802]|uniref:hypothetical protein n=1 Tax=Streptomyces sp. NPDC059802 TaxID=3346952 RepID=UPI003654E0C6
MANVLASAHDRDPAAFAGDCRVPTSRSLAASDEVRAYLVGQLNLALRRPGMFGNELGLRILVDHLLFVECRPEALAEQQRVWEERGAWSNIGVAGAFRDLIPDSYYEYGMASVYAEFAHRRGWLKPDRVLGSDEYAALQGSVRQWAGEDRVWADVVDEFGSPSMLFGGTNPLYGKTLGYLTENPEEPMVSFHLWNGSAPGTGQSWPPEHEEPLLLAVRFGTGPFRQSFTFTPEGQRRLPAG